MVTQNILVVDDDADFCASCAEVLRTAGYGVYEAHDGHAAISLLQSEDIGAVLLDVNMPGLNGLELLDALDDLPPTALLTERDYDVDVIARRPKLFMYLAKPVPPLDLIDAVTYMLTAKAPKP